MIDGDGRSRRGVLLVLAIGVAAVSCAAVLVRLADAPALVIAAYRMGIAGLAMGAGCLVLGRGHGRRPVHRARLLWMALSGGFLALHFGTWIASLHHTSVASSVVLVTSSPLLVAAASWLVLNERVLRREVLGITAGLAGGAVVVAGDWGSRDAVAGDLLALAGAAAMAGYLLIGRKVRAQESVLTYAAVVYPIAGAALVLSALVAGESFVGYPASAFLWMALLALIPQLLGHTSLNRALAHVSATTVAIAVMGEPVLASLLAWVVLAEAPTATTTMGGALIIAGVYWGLLRKA